MADHTTSERLQPSLLDRLTDDEPENLQESRERRVLSSQRLRDSVRRDLNWLFNATNLTSLQALDDYPEVERSTVNYGLPDFAGRIASSIEREAMERLLRRAILDFEPRLTRNSVRVKLSIDSDSLDHNSMNFSIQAELWARPLPLRLFLRTDLDLETGEAIVSEDIRPKGG
ncbi:MAG TPA: type VI secretion system baseplate subunit TssE [Polyangiaceae bacterium]|nr:type VI secretion system baseplate subunit TssE [Polyangiaceae bacterium]